MVSIETISRKEYNKIVSFSAFVPKDAKKPEDPRRVRKMGQYKD